MNNSSIGIDSTVDIGSQPDDPSTLTYPSGDGDLCLIVTGSNHAVGVSITIGYETTA